MKASQTAIDIPYNGDGPEKKMMNKQRIQILRNIVEQLKPNYRELVKLRYFKEYSYEEISVELRYQLEQLKLNYFVQESNYLRYSLVKKILF